MRAGWFSARAITIGLILTALACDPGEPARARVFEGLPLPEGAAVIRPSPPGRDQRRDRLRLVEDLVIPSDRGDGEPIFFQARSLAVDDDGRMYLHDSGAGDIKVFDHDGELVGTLGGPGQGPGELSTIVTSIAVAGGRMLAADFSNSRLSVWEVDSGELAASLPYDFAPGGGGLTDYTYLHGFADGTFAGVFPTFDPNSGEIWRFVGVAANGTVDVEYARIDQPEVIARVAGRRAHVPVVLPTPQMAASPDGRVYITASDGYRVVAYERDGATAWALDAEWRPQPMPDHEIDRAMDAAAAMLRAMGESGGVDRSSVSALPETLPAIASIKVDGHGRLYVFHYEYWDRGRADSMGPDRPVDVYSADGQRLFSGLVDARFGLFGDVDPLWLAAQGDYVYGLDTDPVTREQRLVRHRLDVTY